MDVAIEILQQTTTPWSRVLILLLVVLLFIGRHLYTVHRRRNLEKENIKEIRTALEIKKLMLEIEMMEGGLQHPTPETDKNQSLQLHESNEKIWKPVMRQKTLWPDKMIYGLLGSFFFLLLIVLFNMMVSMDAQHVDQLCLFCERYGGIDGMRDRSGTDSGYATMGLFFLRTRFADTPGFFNGSIQSIE